MMKKGPVARFILFVWEEGEPCEGWNHVHATAGSLEDILTCAYEIPFDDQTTRFQIVDLAIGEVVLDHNDLLTPESV